MNRSGEFKVRTTGDRHCGTLTNQKLPIRYALHCECEVTLDKRGFLFDQISVEGFFQSLRRTTLSCELLTISCAKKLVKIIRTENPGCKIRNMQLTLSPFPYAANMTYTVSPQE